MTSENLTTSALEQLADLNETLKKEKVKLTPEVERYVTDHVRAVQDKLQAGEEVYEEDLAFVEEVKVWASMSEERRVQYPDIRELLKTKEYAEAKKRGISIDQWSDLIRMAEEMGETEEWIDIFFVFPGHGRIRSDGGLWLEGESKIRALPSKLEVEGYLNLDGCTELAALPEGLKVSGDLNIMSCSGLTKLPNDLVVTEDIILSSRLNAEVRNDALRLKREGKIGGEVKIEFK